MIIFITLKVLRDQYGQMLDGLEKGYIEYFQKEKIFPPNAIFILVPNNLEQVEYLSQKLKPACIIFTGGNNVKTNDSLNLNIDDVFPERDAVESFLIDYADQNNIFKLAICRGLQFLNLYYGGNIQYFLKNHLTAKDHLCIYEKQEYWVNSYHNHGIYLNDLAINLKPIVFSKNDKTVEAVINSRKISPTLGVQWHPERKAFPVDLFKIIWAKYFYESSYSRSGSGFKIK